MRFEQKITHYSEAPAEVWGDSRDVVAILCLDFQGLEWLVNEIDRGQQDEAVREFRGLLERARPSD